MKTILLIAINIVLVVSAFGKDNRELVKERHPEARILRRSHEWIVQIKPKCVVTAAAWMPACKCGGYAIRSTTNRRIEANAQHSTSNAQRQSQKVGAEHDVDADTKFGRGTNANRLGSLRDSSRKRGREYGSVAAADTAATTAARSRYYRGHWQSRVEARFPKTVSCVVLDPFGGSGTTAEVASGLGREAVSIDLSAEYSGLAKDRTSLFAWSPGVSS